MERTKVFIGTVFYYGFKYIQFKRFLRGAQKLVDLKSEQLALFFVVEFCTSSVALKYNHL